MDCPNKNCKYYKKKEKARYFMGCNMSGGGYCTRGYCEKQFRRKRKYVRYDRIRKIEREFEKSRRSTWRSINAG